jgi:hypothetical protein
MKRRVFKKTVAMTVLLMVSLHAVANQVPLGAEVETDQIVTKVLAVDAAEHQVVLQGPQGRKIHIQLTDRAKNLGNLQVGDQVNVEVIHSVAAYLDTSVGNGPPENSETIGDIRPDKHNPTPEGEAYRQVRVQLKIIDINLQTHQLTFESASGLSKVVDVVRPEIQAKLKDLKLGQSVRVTYTDILKVTSKH